MGTRNESLNKLLLRQQNDSIKEHVSFLKVDHDIIDKISFCLVYSLNISLTLL